MEKEKKATSIDSKIVDLKTIYEEIPIDDKTLMSLYKELECTRQQKEKEFKHRLLHSLDNDYLSLVVSRLSYCFVKEKYETLFHEMERRGLRIG